MPHVDDRHIRSRNSAVASALCSESDLEIAATLRKFLHLLIAGGSALFAAGVLQDLYAFRSGIWSDVNRVWLLDVDVEKSGFTWVSVLLLALASGASYNEYKRTHAIRNLGVVWLALSALFLLLSFDEFASIHESISSVLAGIMPRGGVFHFAWAVPAGIAALAGLVAMYPFLNALPLRSCIMLVLSAIIFLSGAVLIETLGGMVAEKNGVFAKEYRFLTNIEELLEFTGVGLYAWTVLAIRNQ